MAVLVDHLVCLRLMLFVVLFNKRLYGRPAVVSRYASDFATGYDRTGCLLWRGKRAASFTQRMLLARKNKHSAPIIVKIKPSPTGNTTQRKKS